MKSSGALSLSQMDNSNFAKGGGQAQPQAPVQQQSFAPPQTTGFAPQPQGFDGGQQGFGGQQANPGFGQPVPMQQPQAFSQPDPMMQQAQNFGQPAPMQQPQAFGQPAPMQQPKTGFTQQSVMQPKQRPAGGGVIIKKGQKTSLSQMNPSLDLIEVGLGWDLGPNGQAYDLDVEAFILGANGKVIGDDWFVFYNQPISPDGSIRLLGDSTTGAGAGDDEIIQLKLSQVNAQVQKIAFIVTINDAKENGYNFSNVTNAYVRIVDKSTNKELIKFQLTEYYNTVCSMVVGELYKHNGQWKFSPIGDGTGDDLIGLCARYGVNVAG